RRRATVRDASARPIQMRWPYALFSDDLVRRGHILSEELPQHENGRRRRRHPLREAVVWLVVFLLACFACHSARTIRHALRLTQALCTHDGARELFSVVACTRRRLLHRQSGSLRA